MYGILFIPNNPKLPAKWAKNVSKDLTVLTLKEAEEILSKRFSVTVWGQWVVAEYYANEYSKRN